MLSLVALIVTCLWAFSYHTREFKGGIEISDNGILSYPRYVAHLGKFPLSENGQYSFTVHGLPPEMLDLSLNVLDATYADRSELTSLQTSVSVSITDGSGKEVCTANGNLSDARDRDHPSWILSSSDVSSSFWHQRCLNLPISRYKTYTAKVVLSGAADSRANKMVELLLAGGGNELP